MISPTDTAYRLLPTSPSARELMDAYTPGLFELKLGTPHETEIYVR
jgi:hypothetical protein